MRQLGELKAEVFRATHEMGAVIRDGVTSRQEAMIIVRAIMDAARKGIEAGLKV
jgi:hypothetical protein